MYSFRSGVSYSITIAPVEDHTLRPYAGFDAPIEGVMCLDKPLRAQTLFQAVTSTKQALDEPCERPGEALRLVVCGLPAQRRRRHGTA